MPDYYLHGANVVEISNGARTIRTLATSVIFIVGTAPFADSAQFPLDTPVLLLNEPRKALGLLAMRPAGQGESAADGTLPNAIADIYKEVGATIIVCRVADAANAAATLSNVAGNALLETGMFTAIRAKSIVGVAPKILIAPGFTHTLNTGLPNQVVASMKSIAARLRAIYLVDGPNTIDVAAADMATAIGDARNVVIDPFVKYANDNGVIVTRPASAALAGVIARTDMEKGFWWSPSNQPINGIIGIARPVSFGLSDPATSANWLNERNVTTIINEGGFKVWGQRGTGSDPIWSFLSVRRTADTIYDAIEKSMLWAMDRPQSANLFDDIVESVQGYLDYLKAKGAILGGRCWLDPELNTPATLKAGKIYINFDIEPPAGLERIVFNAYRNDGYYTETIQSKAA